MAEKTLALQLAGNEIIEAVLDTLREKMKRDCFLNANSAYDYFSCEIDVKLKLHDTGRIEEAKHSATISRGEDPGSGEQVEATFNMAPAPPNEIRVQTGQPVPVQTQDSSGKTAIKHVKYSRKDAKKVGAVTAILLALLCVPGIRAQSPVKAPAVVKPEVPPEVLDTSERIALQAIHDKQQEALNEARAFEIDVTKHHPGYHYNEKTGALDKDVKPEPKK